ncbi:MAG: amino acid ABC transporter ATP-binding protein [Coriobacteriia bacterium]|nr:amino acid ABC transporter ATP-binding protein [Coriobacteriia bacterium]
MNNSQAIVELKNASKSFGEHTILKNISLTVKPGEVVALIGPSGSGKSTLLRILTLLETMDKGNLLYDQQEIAREDAQGRTIYNKQNLSFAKSKFGLVFQNFNLFPHLSALQNITDPLKLVAKKSGEEALAIAQEMLAKMNLEDKANLYPWQLSGGQKQRLAIARALAMRPEILYFDEPTSALDPLLTQEVLRVMKGLAEENLTMLIVTHEMAFARMVADRVIFMQDGEIVEAGSAEDIFERAQDERTKNFLAFTS